MEGNIEHIIKHFLNQIIIDLGTMIYQYLWASVLITLLIFVFINYSKKSNAVTVLKELFDSIRSTEGFKKFISVLYLVFLLQRTIFNRGPWGNPLSNPVGDWFLLLDKNTLNFEIIDNLILFIPLNMVLNWLNISWFPTKISFGYNAMVSFALSCSIEIFQLLFRVGTFQLSDLFFNTLGGLIGFYIYKIIIFVKNVFTNKL